MNENALALVLLRVEYLRLISGAGKHNYFFIIGVAMSHFIDSYFLGNFHRKIVASWQDYNPEKSSLANIFAIFLKLK